MLISTIIFLLYFSLFQFESPIETGGNYSKNQYHLRHIHGIDNPGLEASITVHPTHPHQVRSNDNHVFDVKNHVESLYHQSLDKWHNLDKLETQSNPETYRYRKHINSIMLKNKQLPLEAEDIQREQMVPLKRRSSTGDMQMKPLRVCKLYFTFSVKWRFPMNLHV